MDIKKWLSRGYWAEKERKVLENERSKAYNDLFPSSDVAGERVQQSRKNNTEEKYVKYLDYDKRLKKQIEKLLKIKIEIFDVISGVEDMRLCTLLELRYIKFYTWEKIAEAMNYEQRQVYRIHCDALNEAEKVLKNKRCQ